MATGATARRLGIPSEGQFWSSGISACAICDGETAGWRTCRTTCPGRKQGPVVVKCDGRRRAGASSNFRGQDLAVVGGGDTAAEEAIYLTKYGKHVRPAARCGSADLGVFSCPACWPQAGTWVSLLAALRQCSAASLAGVPVQAAGQLAERRAVLQVHLLVRGERMRASGAMQDRVTAHNKVTVHYQTRIEDAYGDAKGLSGLHLLEGPDGAQPVLTWAETGLRPGQPPRPSGPILLSFGTSSACCSKTWLINASLELNAVLDSGILLQMSGTTSLCAGCSTALGTSQTAAS